MKKFIQKSLSALGSKQSNIFTAAFFIVITTIFAQILGFVKYRLLVSIFGASSDLGVFLAAFRIPDFLFQVLIAGALSTTFIPIFSEYIRNKKRDDAFRFTSSLITIGLSGFVVVAIVVVIFAPYLSRLIAPGFNDAEIKLMTNLMRIIQMSQVFFVLGIIFTGILQSFQRFLIPGIASALYNLGIILGIIIFSLWLNIGIVGAAIGVLIGAALFALVQLPLLIKTGFFYIPSFHIDQNIKKIAKLMVPRSFTVLFVQIAMTANVFFASLISARSLVIFDLAQTLMLAPIVLFGQSIAQASFPALSLKNKDKKEFLSIFTSSLNQILYLTLPVSAILIVLRIPVVRLFYGASRFDWQATVDTGLTLSFLSISISAQALIFLFSRAFYALKDTKTPFFITGIAVTINIILSYYFILVQHLPIYYLGASLSIGNIIGVVLMLIALNSKIGLPKLDIFINAGKIGIATLVMGVALYIPIKLLDQLVFDTTRTINLLMLTGIASLSGFLAYIFFTWLLDIREVYYIFSVIKRFKYGRRAVKGIEELIDGTKLNP